MKKLYRKGKVHPWPPPSTIADHLSLLPATILSLTTALPFQDKEVLAYLICHHQQQLPWCYMWFWARWDSTPNRQMIHEIIEAYEERLFQEKKQVKKNKKGRRKRVSIHDSKHGHDQGSSGNGSANLNEQKLEFMEMNCQNGEEREVESEMGSIRNIISFIGDSIWGVWNRS
ncbi:hypothetical protein CRYUN_Cryun01aG0124900 [Craigia yunnanensis]